MKDVTVFYIMNHFWSCLLHFWSVSPFGKLSHLINILPCRAEGGRACIIMCVTIDFYSVFRAHYLEAYLSFYKKILDSKTLPYSSL